MHPDNKIGSRGQALLITVLIMAVILTIGLAVVSRSIVEEKTAADEANSEKAFSAAEAGIDQVLKTGAQVSNQSLGNNASISNVTIANVSNAKILLNNGTQVLQDDGTDVWLSPYPTSSPPTYTPWTGALQVYWGSAPSSCNDAALEISIISQVNTTPISYTISRYAYDPCSTRATMNKFTSVANGTGTSISSNGQTLTFNYGTPAINVTNGILAKVIPLYTDTIIGVGGSVPLPSQGKFIISTGVSGNTQRKITYFQGYDSVPSELFYSLFSAK